MILTDREIQTALLKGAIVIDPRPPADAYSSTSVDLTLDPFLTLFDDPTHGLDLTIDPTMKKEDTEKVLEKITKSHEISAVDGYVLKPRCLILAYTKEYVDMRNDTKYAARVEGKSSLARLGLSVHMTAPTVHAGFDGRVRLEVINEGHYPIRLRTGMPICQLIFEQTLGTPDKGYNGQFSGQGPAASEV